MYVKRGWGVLNFPFSIPFIPTFNLSISVPLLFVPFLLQNVLHVVHCFFFLFKNV